VTALALIFKEMKINTFAENKKLKKLKLPVVTNHCACSDFETD
jgi:hypothetical protein